MRRIYSIRCSDFCSLLKINRNDFLNLLKEYPEDYEKFCKIKDSIGMYSNLGEICKKCYCCSN